MDGSQVYDAWQAGLQDEIRDYCETDVANTWLLYNRFRLMRGALTADEYEAEMTLARETLGALEGDHWQEFLSAWST
jgi:predicted PolB exonuclease-like 3'-5' exonuclease